MRRHRSDRGATGVEYSLIVAAIAGLIFVTATLVGSDVKGLWEAIDF